MICYRHPSAVTPPDLADWQHRESAAALCFQRSETHQHVAVVDPVLWQIPTGNNWRPIGDGWEAVLVPNKGGVVPSRDISRLSCWAPVLPVEDAKGEQWLAPVILNRSGHRAFSVSYAGADFLPNPTEDQARAEAITREARAQMEKEHDGGDGIAVNIACRWAAVLLSITSHISAAAIAELGILDDTLVRRILIAATGLDRRLDGEI